jgi:ubiquinone biosynthesis protein UbiJ
MDPPLDFANHVLAQSPAARARLSAHAGAVLRVEAPPVPLFPLLLRIAPGGELIRHPERAGADAGGVYAGPAGADPARAADLVIRLDLASLPLFLADPEAARKSVRIEGDAALAASVDAVLREARWDAEEDLAQIVGDVAAHRLGRVARGLAAWAADASHGFAESTAAFFTDEEPLLARRDEVERLRQDIARARDDVERLEKRIEALRAMRG